MEIGGRTICLLFNQQDLTGIGAYVSMGTTNEVLSQEILSLIYFLRRNGSSILLLFLSRFISGTL
jgi:hypothetical protein